MYDIPELHDHLRRRIARDGRRIITEMIPADSIKRTRSLRACHLPAEQRPLLPMRESRAYTPELSEHIERDPNLCDGARRCARILAAYIYRRDRDDRSSQITVSYLSRALRRCRRTVQRYLRQLERAGYIKTHVIASPRSRLCIGLRIALLKPLFPHHHAQKWPIQLLNPGATVLSQKQRPRYKRLEIPVSNWALRCMNGVYRALVQTIPPLSAVA